MISKNFKNRTMTSLLLFGLIYLMFNYDIVLIFTILILGVFSIIEFINITKKIFNNKISLISINTLFIFYISCYCILFSYFNNFLHLKIILFTLLIACAASDIGGFIFGKILKGPKLTKISPKKTLAGAMGSLITTFISMAVIIYLLTNNLNYKIFWVSLATSIACQAGDLFFSYLKRKAKIKDTGNFFPGHGGVLDRVDGILIGLPLGFISLIILFK